MCVSYFIFGIWWGFSRIAIGIYAEWNMNQDYSNISQVEKNIRYWSDMKFSDVMWNYYYNIKHCTTWQDVSGRSYHFHHIRIEATVIYKRLHWPQTMYSPTKCTEFLASKETGVQARTHEWGHNQYFIGDVSYTWKTYGCLDQSLTLPHRAWWSLIAANQPSSSQCALFRSIPTSMWTFHQLYTVNSPLWKSFWIGNVSIENIGYTMLHPIWLLG